jgi:hypothetical protein
MLTVQVKGNTAQMAAALRELAERLELWDDDHAPMGNPGNIRVGEYHAKFDDWEGPEPIPGLDYTGDANE